MKILLATNNSGKVKRYKRLASLIGNGLEIVTPAEEGIETIDVVENADTLLGNAKLKAQAYFRKTDLPILGNDTGFWVEGEGFVDAPKRIALGGKDEATLTQEEKAEHMINFWTGIAKKYGGEVPAVWHDAYVLLTPSGEDRTGESVRKCTLTDTITEPMEIFFPMRSLYITKATGKASVLHNDEEWAIEMNPIKEAVERLL